MRPHWQMPQPERNIVDPRLLGTLNLINRSLESIAASLSQIAATAGARWEAEEALREHQRQNPVKAGAELGPE